MFLRNAAQLAAVVVPAAVLFYTVLPWWFVFPYMGWLFATRAGRYTLMLHAVCHRPIFQREHRWLEALIPWGLGPFFGHSPTSFYVHHMGMHHPENNLDLDLSTTLPYQRDRFAHFLHYWARFFFFGTGHLVRYLWVRRRTKLARRFVLGELAWFGTVATLLWLAPGPTLVVFVTPFVLIRWFMMAGNWSQHAFVDVDDPGNCYRNSTCLVNIRYNHKCFNDGYHIVHHLKPSLHWTAMRTWFEERQETFGAEDALVLDGLGNNQVVWWCLMTGQYDRLARHVVDLPGAPVRSHEEKVAWLQDRVRRRVGERKRMLRFDPVPSERAAAA